MIYLISPRIGETQSKRKNFGERELKTRNSTRTKDRSVIMCEYVVYHCVLCECLWSVVWFRTLWYRNCEIVRQGSFCTAVRNVPETNYEKARRDPSTSGRNLLLQDTSSKFSNTTRICWINKIKINKLKTKHFVPCTLFGSQRAGVYERVVSR